MAKCADEGEELIAGEFPANRSARLQELSLSQNRDFAFFLIESASAAPLIDLASGQLMGVHIGGRSQNVAPPSYRDLIPIVKCAYSNDIPGIVVELIRKAQRGEEIEPIQQDEDESESDDEREASREVQESD